MSSGIYLAAAVAPPPGMGALLLLVLLLLLAVQMAGMGCLAWCSSRLSSVWRWSALSERAGLHICSIPSSSPLSCSAEIEELELNCASYECDCQQLYHSVTRFLYRVVIVTMKQICLLLIIYQMFRFLKSLLSWENVKLSMNDTNLFTAYLISKYCIRAI